jgi:hypothetical protein
MELLEDRLAPALVTYTAATKLLDFTAAAGRADNVTVTAPAANSVRIVVAAGDTISLAGDVGTGFALSAGNTQLDINTALAPATNFNVNLGDQDDTLAFGLANTPNGVTNVNLQGGAGTDTVTLNALTITGNLTVASETINLGGIVTASGNVSLTVVNSLTGGPVDDVADIAGAVITLNVTGAGNAIGGNASTTPLEIDAATRLDAATNNGNMVLKNVAGDLPLGALNAGNAMINLVARNGAITDANGAALNLTAAGGVTLTTTGTGSAIGTTGDPIETAIGSLTATTFDGGIFVADSNGPGLIINSVLANEKGQSPFIDGSNHIVVFDPPASPSGPPTNPHAGVDDVSITAQGPVLLGSVTAPDAVTITSVTGGILDINQAANNVLARSVNLVAQGAAAGSAVGRASDPVESTVESFSAGTTNGGIFLAQGIDNTAVSVVAGGAGNDVVVTSTGSSLRIRTITAPGNVTVANSVGSLLDDNGAAVNLTGQVVSLTGKTGIGTAADPLETNTSDLRATVSNPAAVITPAASISIDNKNGGLVALNSVAAKTNAGDVTIHFLGGSLSFTASTDVLSASGAPVTFETTSGDVKLGLVDAGGSAVSVTAAGAITDDVNDAAVDLRGGTVTLNAGTGIGVSGNTIDTDVAALVATTTTGDIFISEANALVLSATSKGFTDPSAMTGSDINVEATTGNLTVGTISALGTVTLTTGGALSAPNGSAVSLTANTLNLTAAHGIGTSSAVVMTLANTLSANGGAGGGLFLSNNQTLSVTSASATGGPVSITALGDLDVGTVTAAGQAVTLTATGGDLVNATGPALNITALSATLSGSMIGAPGDDLETEVSTITASATGGGIFIHDLGTGSLTLTATAAGAVADIDFTSAGSIVLMTVTAPGNTVTLRAAGSITASPEPVNITAQTLDIVAPGGIGTSGTPLEVLVGQVAAADGGGPGVFMENAGPLEIEEAAFTVPGSGTLTFEAASITIANMGGSTAELAPGRSLLLKTGTGPIVFLNPADTIETSNGGTITVKAGTIPGSGGVAVIGNLTTEDSSITVTADGNITIGTLNAGTGNVTVQSAHGLILKGNGPSQLNVIAGTATLSGSAPTLSQLQLDQTEAVAAAAGANAQAAATAALAETLARAIPFRKAAVAVDSANLAADAVAAGIAVAAELGGEAAVQTTAAAQTAALSAYIALQATATALLQIAGPAQAVPVIGDVGTFEAYAEAQTAAYAALNTELALLNAETEEEAVLNGLTAAAADATAVAITGASDLALAIAELKVAEAELKSAEAAAENAIILNETDAVVATQAIAALAQGNVIGSPTTPLVLQVTGAVNVTAGPTDSFLQVVGDTAVDQIQATGSVTLISTGAITNGAAPGVPNILATGLTIRAVNGIGTAANPLFTRVGTLNATNTGSGDIAITNNVGTPGPLDITGVSNTGGGDVFISNKGNSAAGQGITVSGPVSATGAGAEVTIHSGSPLTISTDITAAAAILLEAGETAGPGDNLTVNPGVTIQSTGSSVTLRAGDDILIPAGATIRANTTITITGAFNNADAAGTNVVVTGTLIAPSALIGVDPAADGNDTFTITPSATTPITVDAEDGTDTLNFNADGLPVTILGNQIIAAGRAPVTFLNFEHVNILNAAGGGSITLNTAAGVADALILTGTGQKAGTFTLNGGVPISFTGLDSFTFNAGDMNDAATVTPFATSVLPWNVAVTIDGGTGTDRITYNNVAGLLDSTAVTATAPGAGHVDSPGVTSALNSQLVTFANLEDLTVNANPGEDEKLTVNLRDTSVADTANLLFNPTPGADDLELVGLFKLDIDTDHYVGLTLNGRGGDDTFNVTPGPIPVFVDGGDPIGATAGDSLNFNPAGAYVLEPGPHNDEGGLNADGAQRVSWVHVEAISVTGGGPGTFLGTNGNDEITIVARDSSTHAGADGVQDFTVSLNSGPSVLFLDTAEFLVDALAGDDHVDLRAPAPNNAVWNVGMTLFGNDGNDVITAATGVGGSPVTLEGGAGDDFLEGGAGDERFFGNEGNDTFVGGAGNDTFDGGSGFDVALIRGTPADDVVDVFQNAPSAVNDSGYGLALTLNGVAQTDTITQDTAGSPRAVGTRPTVEEVRIEAGSGNDLIRVGVSDAYSDLDASNGVPGQSLRFDVQGDAPNASDRLVVRDDGAGDLVALYQGADQRSGRVSVAPGATIPGGGNGLADVVYAGIERVDVTPLDPVTSGTGTDGMGRIVVFHPDPFETNDSRLNAGQLARVGQNATSPGIFPGAVTTSFSTNGDEDWYEFRPTGTNTFQIKVLFDKVSTLANGRAGLPGNGDLSLDIYDANGTLITSGVADASGNNRTATFAATNDPAFPQFNRIFVRVKGAGAQPSLSINRYDFANLSGAGSGIPGASVVDTNGPRVTGVNIANDPLTAVDESAYNVFDPKPASGPTPLVPRMEVHFVDSPSRAPGLLYPAIDPHLFDGSAGQKPAMGLFSVVGDLVGNVPIKDVVLTNDPVVQGQPATATVTIIFDLSSPTFAGGLPDDRYTLTVLDGLSDPAGTALDGESKAAQPTTVQSFPSGNGQRGGNFAARFTVDSRPEIGTFGNGKSFIDLNGNGIWDPQGSGDAVHHDNSFTFGVSTDTLFAGNFAAAGAATANGYDKLAAYGKVGGQNRFLFDLTGDGQPDLTVVPTLQLNGTPVAGDFAPNHPGQEIGIFTSTTWYLDTNGDNNLDASDATFTNALGNNLPIVGDFDGDGKFDLGTYDASANTFAFDLGNNGYGQKDATIAFGFPTLRERPVAADMNRDGVTDIGLYVPRSDNSSETLAADWYFLVSQGTPTAGSVNTLNHAFNQTPFSNDRYFTFGDSFNSPIVGNFDPPVASGPIGIPPVLVGVPQFAVGSGTGGPATVTEYNPDGSVATTFNPFPGTTGGVRTAVADFNGDGTPDVAAGTGPGAVAEVKILDGKTGAVLFDVHPFADFTGGVFVAAGDVTGDGKAELVITPDLSGGPRVEIYSGSDFQEIANFFGIDDPNFRGGARVAVGDVSGDGIADLVISAGFGGGPRISVYDGRSLARGQQVHVVPDFFLFESTLRNGAYVAVGDVDGDGYADIVGGGGPGGGPRVLVLSGRQLLSAGAEAAFAAPIASFFAGDPAGRAGTPVAVANLDGDRYADVVAGAGNGSQVTAYVGRDLAAGTPTESLGFDAYPGFDNGVFVG